MGSRGTLPARVRRVAEEVAQICTGMDDPSLADCFSELFGLSSDDKLFGEFRAAYRITDRLRPHGHGQIICRVRAVAELLEGVGR